MYSMAVFTSLRELSPLLCTRVPKKTIRYPIAETAMANYSHDKDHWPELNKMISTGLPANNEPGNAEAREPKGHEVSPTKDCC